MTAKKAIEFLRMHFEYLKERWKPYPDYNVLEAIRFAISAIEKQIPKKPKKIEAEGYRYTDTYRCPTCCGNFSGTGIADYCYHCGQKLDWSDEE